MIFDSEGYMGNNTSNAKTCYPMMAEFQNSEEGPASSLSTLKSSPKAHLRLRLPDYDPKLPSLSVGKVNRNARVVPNSPSFGDCGTEASVKTSGTKESSQQSRGPSLIWSANGDAAMPEIVELNLMLRSDDFSIVQEGVAHIVFFGNPRDSGVVTMELPIKKKSLPVGEFSSPNHSQSALIIFPDAYIRVQFCFLNTNGKGPANRRTRSDASKSSQPGSNFMDEARLGNFTEKMTKQDDELGSEICSGKMDQHEQVKFDKKRGLSRFMCSGLEVGHSLKAFIDAFRKCQPPNQNKRTRYEQYELQLSKSMMESTIATRESWDL